MAARAKDIIELVLEDKVRNGDLTAVPQLEDYRARKAQSIQEPTPGDVGQAYDPAAGLGPPPMPQGEYPRQASGGAPRPLQGGLGQAIQQQQPGISYGEQRQLQPPAGVLPTQPSAVGYQQQAPQLAPGSYPHPDVAERATSPYVRMGETMVQHPGRGGMGKAVDPYAGIPDDLRPQHDGMYFPFGYSETISEAHDAGRLTDQQYEMLSKKYDSWLKTTLGIAGRVKELEYQRKHLAATYEEEAKRLEADGDLQAAAALRDYSDRMDENQAERVAYVNEYKRGVDRQMSAIRQAAEDIKNVKFDAMAGLSSPVMGLALALGGWIQGGRGGENPAMAAIRTKIDANLAEQSKELQKTSMGLEAQENILGHMMRYFDSEEQASQASKLYLLDRVHADLERIKNTTASVTTAKRAEGLIPDVEAEFEITQKNFELMVQQAAAKAAQARAAAAASAARAKQQQGNPFIKAKLKPEQKLQLMYREAPQYGGFIKDPTEFRKLNEKQRVMSEAVRLAKEIRAESGGGTLDFTKYPQLAQKQARIIALINRGSALGAYDAGLQRLYDKMLADPGSFSGQITAWIGGGDEYFAQFEHMLSNELQFSQDAAVIPGYSDGEDIYFARPGPERMNNTINRALESAYTTPGMGTPQGTGEDVSQVEEELGFE